MEVVAASAALSVSDQARIRCTRIGVIGGGQLGLMLAEAAQAMGFAAFTIIDPTPDCPAHDLATHHLIGAFDDARLITALADYADIVTFEIELAGDAPLRQLQAQGVQVHPSPETLGIIKDKLRQKQFLLEAGIAVAPFREVSAPADLQMALKEFGAPVVVKSRFGGYDGRGNFVVHSDAEIDAAFAKLGRSNLYVEQYVPFVKELAVMVARNVSGQVVAYPTVETVHVRNICELVIAPAPVPPASARSARELAMQAVAQLGGAGVFGIELFLLSDGRVLVNEIAPRPHNSGHYTIEACSVSQFEQHLRAIIDLPLGGAELKVPAAVMLNILGEREGPALLVRQTREIEPGAVLHIYGKARTAIDRKMGHLTLVGDEPGALIERACALRAQIEV